MRLASFFIAGLALCAGHDWLRERDEREAFRLAIAASMNSCKTAPLGQWVKYVP